MVEKEPEEQTWLNYPQEAGVGPFSPDPLDQGQAAWCMGGVAMWALPWAPSSPAGSQRAGDVTR